MTTEQAYKKFLQEFFTEVPEALLENNIVLGRSLYYDPKKGAEFAKDRGITIHSTGQYLGEEKKTFIPSPFCIERASAFATAEMQAILDEKGAWLFLCARDVFGSQIIEGEAAFKKPVFVYDKHDQILGYGEWTVERISFFHKNKMVLKHKLDRGAYIRR